RANTSVGSRYSLDTFLAVRIPLNQEADAKGLPRNTHWKERGIRDDSKISNGSKGGKVFPAKEKEKDKNAFFVNPLTPVSAVGEKPKQSERGRDGTVRFMLD